MLFYLDNARSMAAPENRPAMQQRGFGGRFGFGRRAMVMRPQQQQGKEGGLNENYARESWSSTRSVSMAATRRRT